MSTIRPFTSRRRASRFALAAATSIALLAAGACSSDDNSGEASPEPAKDGAVNVAFAYGFGGGGPEGEFIAGMNCYASQNGLDEIVVTYADGDPSKQLSDFDSLVARAGEIDGIYALPNDPIAAAPAYKAARDAGIIVVDPMTADADGNYPTDADSHVAPDDPNVPGMIMKDMASDDASIKRIVILSPPPGQVMTDMKTEAMKAEGADLGIEVVEVLSVENMATDKAQQVLEDFLTANKDIQAVFAHNGAMARGAALAIKSQGLDLKVYSIDADPETIEAVVAGDIHATYGADLFEVAYQASKEMESIKAGGAPSPKLIPFTRYDADNNTVTPIDQRCS